MLYSNFTCQGSKHLLQYPPTTLDCLQRPMVLKVDKNPEMNLTTPMDFRIGSPRKLDESMVKLF